MRLRPALLRLILRCVPRFSRRRGRLLGLGIVFVAVAQSAAP